MAEKVIDTRAFVCLYIHVRLAFDTHVNYPHTQIQARPMGAVRKLKILRSFQADS